jgi:2-polyprenyl-3-methyl-5-hydroxy-6-metoxy-1,4-benzoquinol methylase
MTSHSTPLNDLAGREYWNVIWESGDIRRYNPRSYYDYCLSKLFHQLITPNSRVLEIGCGGSRWLPYFAKSLQCEVWGIDYSTAGVALTQRHFEADRVAGTIILGDAFDNHQLPQKYFDVVWSGGFVEHFADVSSVVRKLSAYLKPNGLMITLIPNLEGCIGWLHRVVDRQVYEAHVKISPQVLDAAHCSVGFVQVLPSRYFGVFSLGVVNFNRFRKRLPRFLDRLLWLGVLAVQQGICLPCRICDVHPESKSFSPWIIGAYRLPFAVS